MKISADEFRQYLDEVEKHIEVEKRKFKLAKTLVKKSFTFENLDNYLNEQRRAFDHAFTTRTMRYSLGSGNIRENLDLIWENQDKKMAKWQRQFFDRNFIPVPVYARFAILFSHFSGVWYSYLDAVSEFAKGLKQ